MHGRLICGVQPRPLSAKLWRLVRGEYEVVPGELNVVLGTVLLVLPLSLLAQEVHLLHEDMEAVVVVGGLKLKVAVEVPAEEAAGRNLRRKK